MHILFVAPHFPYPLDVGTKIRGFHLLRGYAAAHAVTLVCFVPEGNAPQDVGPVGSLCHRIHCIPFRPYGTVSRDTGRRNRILWGDKGRDPPEVQYLTSDLMTRRIREELGRTAYDVLHVENLLLVPNVMELLEETRAFRILDLHDIESVKALRRMRTLPLFSPRRGKAYLAYRRLRAYEDRVLPLFDASVVCSPVDKRVLVQRGLSRLVHVAPNGADFTWEGRGKETGPSETPGTLLFLGALNYGPNEDAVIYFAEKILPRVRRKVGDVVFLVAGKNPSERVRELGRDGRVRVLGFVEDARRVIQGASVLVVPLRIGSGTRIKILEATAAGTPVVTTSIGCEGIDVQHGEHVWIADSTEGFARGCIELLQDREKRERMAAKARERARSLYDWGRIGEGLRRFVERQVEIRKGSPSPASCQSCRPLSPFPPPGA